MHLISAVELNTVVKASIKTLISNLIMNYLIVIITYAVETAF
jgi:hypothetical protein